MACYISLREEEGYISAEETPVKRQPTLKKKPLLKLREEKPSLKEKM